MLKALEVKPYLYELSGKVDWRVVPAVLGAAGVGLFCGMLYGYWAWMMWVGVFAALPFLQIFLYYLAGLAVKYSHIRSLRVARMVVGVAGLAMLYGAWVSYLAIELHEPWGEFLGDPVYMANSIVGLIGAETGRFTVNPYTHVAFWFTEALLLVFPFVWFQPDLGIYCQAGGQRIGEITTLAVFAPNTGTNYIKLVKNWDISKVVALNPPVGGQGHSMHLEMGQCSCCESPFAVVRWRKKYYSASSDMNLWYPVMPFHVVPSHALYSLQDALLQRQLEDHEAKNARRST